MISALTVSDATADFAPGVVWVRWQADIPSGVLITVDGQGVAVTYSRPGSNAVLIPLSTGTHSICVEEGNY